MQHRRASRWDRVTAAGPIAFGILAGLSIVVVVASVLHPWMP